MTCSFAKQITVQLGIMPIHLKMEVATISETVTHVVCTNHGQHDAARVKQSIACPECKTIGASYYDFPERAVMENKALKVLSKSDIEQVKGAARTGREAVDKDGRTIANPAEVELKFHPRMHVYGATLAGDSVQNVYPDLKRGGSKGYEMLCHYLITHPEHVAVMVWAPTKSNALWVLEVSEGRLVASKRCWPEQVKPAQPIEPVMISAAEQGLFDQIVELTVADFDVNEYVNEAAKGLQDLLNDQSAEPAAEVLTKDNLAMLEALLASVKQQQASTRGKAA